MFSLNKWLGKRTKRRWVRRHVAHCDVTVMRSMETSSECICSGLFQGDWLHPYASGSLCRYWGNQRSGSTLNNMRRPTGNVLIPVGDDPRPSANIIVHDNDVIKWKYFRVTSEFPSQRPVTQSFDVFFDLRLTYWWSGTVNTLRSRKNGRYFADDVFKCIFFNANVWIAIEISLDFVQGSIHN